MEKIKARKLTFAEVAELDKGASFLVPVFDRHVGALVPAQLSSPLDSEDQTTLKAKTPDMRSMPVLSIQSTYGSMYGVGANEVWVEDPAGEEVNLIEGVGTQVSLTLYAPGMEGSDVLDRARKALRAEFGAGILQLRQETHRPVPETGLPPVLGVPDGQIPRFV